MKKTLSVALISLTMLCGSSVIAQSLDDLENDTATPGNVLTYGMGQGQNRHSQLDAINKENVGNLVPVWSYSLADLRGQETFPLIMDGTMYVTTHASTMALDAKTGKQKWKTPVDYPNETPRVACCGIVNRGAALYDGKVYRTTLDAHVVALDAATGEEVWKTQSIDFRDGYSMTVAPLIADGVVISGISGGEYGIRGFIEGHDAMTGERLWRTYTVPEPGEPGSETWPEGDQWTRGGGPAWITGTFDPDLNMVYWGTGNASSWNAGLRPGDNLYTASILSLDPKTGKINWHYQTTPNDAFDYDAVNELILTELEGQKVLMQANRNGFFYVINRETGQLLAANKFIDRVDWAEKIDLKTGKPVETPMMDDARTGEQVQFWPSALGGKNWAHAAYDSKRQSVFINTNIIGMDYKAVESTYRAGTFYWGAEFAFAWPEGPRGDLRAIDPLTGVPKWVKPTDIPRYASILSTDGGVLFTGTQTGEFEAFDSDTGDKLWEFQLGSGTVGQPVTWEMEGTQYISMASGSGGVYALFAGDERLASVPAGGSIWTFAVKDAE